MKRGQFTTILIVAVVAVLAILLGVLLFSQDVQDSVDAGSEAAAVQQYIEACLQQIGREALTELSRQGGYIDDPVSNEFLPATSRTYVGVPPGSSTRVRYWRHIDGECPSCNERVSILPLTGSDSIQAGLERYVSSNITSCLEGSAVSYRSEGEPEATVTFATDATILELDYPVVIEDEDTTRISTYRVSLDVPFKKAYETAVATTMYIHSQDLFAQKVSRQVLASLSSGERPSIPPMQGGVAFERVEPWTMTDVRAAIQPLLSDEISKVMLDGGREPVPLPTTPADRQNQNLVIPTGSTAFEGVDASTFDLDASYTPWHDVAIDIDGNGASSWMIMPQPYPFADALGFLPQITDVNYAYDLSYPVVLRLNDPTAFGGEGFSFQFAYETYLHNNYAYNGTSTSLSSASTGDGTYFCDPAQWNTGVYSIHARNASNGAPLKGARVELSCGETTCPVGSTNASGTLRTRLPVCGLGNLTVSKPTYASFNDRRTFAVDSQDSITASLQSELPINVKVVVRPVEKVPNPARDPVEEPPQWQPGATDLSLSPYQDAVVIFQHTGRDEYVRVARYNGSESLPSVELLPGSYEVSGYVTEDLNASGNEFTIEEQDVGGRSIGSVEVTEGTTLEPIYFNETLMVGQVQFDSPVDISVSDLGENVMNVRVAGIDTEANPLAYHVDLNILSEFGNVTAENPSTFLPTFTDS
jgi:hypothetical protein